MSTLPNWKRNIGLATIMLQMNKISFAEDSPDLHDN